MSLMAKEKFCITSMAEKTYIGFYLNARMQSHTNQKGMYCPVH